jgi:endogenous inhibitor of DNA gyrase (YacG/DUF329 family)
MAYPPKTLVLGRCVRCGKKLYRGDEYYYCPHCDIPLCPICAKKTFGKCPVCGRQLARKP